MIHHKTRTEKAKALNATRIAQFEAERAEIEAAAKVSARDVQPTEQPKPAQQPQRQQQHQHNKR